MKRPGGPWLVAVAVTLPTFMEVLDTSIANVALRNIAGGLSAPATDAAWVITSYLAANAIVLPVSGWLSQHLGRRRYFLISIALFTAASLLCGLSTSLWELVLFRVMQGLAGGGLQPNTQGVLMDVFPRERQGAAMTVFGVVALIAPILGPTFGGWITDHYSWHWIFFINVPVGLGALAACAALLEDPPYLKQQRAELLSRPIRFDFLGLGLIVLGLASLEALLSKGQEWDWFGDPFYRTHLLAVTMVLALGGAIWWELHTPSPIVDLRPLANRNFAAGSLITVLIFGTLFGSLTSLPLLLQNLFGYDATNAGLVMTPAGIGSLVMMPVVGFLIGRRIDTRKLIAVGLVVMTLGSYFMALMTLQIGPWQVAWPRVVQSMGVALIFAPLNVAAYATIAPSLRPSAVGLFNLLRNEGGSIGTSVAQTIIARREQFHLLRLNENLDPFNPVLGDVLDQQRAAFLQQTGDPTAANQLAWQSIDQMRQQQAASLAYFDTFWLFAVVSLCLLPLVLLMRRAVAEPGQHVGAE